MTPGARRAVNVVMSWLAASAAGLVVLPLLLIFAFLLWQGASAVNLDFFVRLPKPVGETGGGMANAIVGTLILVALAAGLGLPLGILGGLYLAESRDRRLPWLARFLADVLNGVPSIVIGIFAYTLIVLPMRGFSALAGGFGFVLVFGLRMFVATEISLPKRASERKYLVASVSIPERLPRLLASHEGDHEWTPIR